MIPQIKEINFPEYATLSTATASLVDMGDKTITAQVKIDGSIVPDFSYDWEVEFQGERYIQPLREPQASKSNESINSIIDLTFYHKGIYDLKRYFFVSTVELEAGTLMADNYVVPLRLNIAEFVVYLNNVLKYYYGDTYKVFLNPDYEYDETDRRDIDINYTKIWDVLIKIHEWFGVRWSWDTQQDDVAYYFIKIGYPSIEVSHVFEYGFEGGLLKFERQVQDAEIANVVFGRGSSENIPFRYFKNKSEDNPTFHADPDWIPELENIYFANLRGKTFRDYVKGWKAKHYGGEVMATPTEEYTRGYNDETFNPIEYVKDNESIAKYGEIQKGLEHNEEIKPTIQGVTIEGRGRVDQVVDVELVVVDENAEGDVPNIENTIIDIELNEFVETQKPTNTYTIITPTKTYTIPNGYKGNFIKDINIIANEYVTGFGFRRYDGVLMETIPLDRTENPLQIKDISIDIIDNNTRQPISNLTEIEEGTIFYLSIKIKVDGFLEDKKVYIGDNPNHYWDFQYDKERLILVEFSCECECTNMHGLILGNYESGFIRKSKSIQISGEGTNYVELETSEFTIAEENAPVTNIDMPIRVIASLDGAQYDTSSDIYAVDVKTNEKISGIALPAGTYKLYNKVLINNYSKDTQEFKVELLPTYIYYSYKVDSWKPTFDIWVKNIWNTSRNETPLEGNPNITVLEKPSAYEHRIWDAILGNHLGNEAKVVFSSGRLSGYSDWEFVIAHTPKYDTSKSIDGVPSEWRITLYKSDAEIDATGKYIPSIMTQASAGDHFYFTGIELPHQYVLWAEEKLDEYKQKELRKVSEVSPTIVIHTDKVRINEQDGIANALNIGYKINTKDVRFLPNGLELILQSITYTWDANTILYPNIEIVLSNDVPKNKFIVRDIVNDVSKLDEDLTSLSTRTNSEFKVSMKTTTKRFNKTDNEIRKVNERVTYLEKNSGVLDLTELTTAVGKNTNQIESISTIKVITPSI